MSKTVDERIVSMQFDNRQFEKNVSTSMSTIEKLKQSLSFKGMSKGLNDINEASKKVDMSGMSKGIETVNAKFSSMQVIGATVLSNITSYAMQASKKLLEPMISGFREYETQINAVQTILANTQSKGTTIDDVTNALDELNTYADKTIYNFTEMTRNIGTFTAAGVDLETSVGAIQGIANLAAVSGSTSQQASTAMYQLSQALATGTVKLMDWNSVVNAGMGGEVFQNALKETSALLGTGAEAAIKAEGSFRESLRTGWLTSEVLTETLKKFTTSGANEYVAKYTGLSLDAVKAETKMIEGAQDEAAAIDKAAEALAKKSGKNKEEIKQVLQMANTATNAATKVKTFTQLIETVKESMGSGWAKTWQLIIGDFEEAKEFWTRISDVLTGDNGIITRMNDARNNLLEKVMNNPFTEMMEKVKSITGGTEKLTEATKAVTKATEAYNEVVNRVIKGEFGNGQTRWSKLAEDGYDWAHVQNLVNEKLGDSTRHATNYKEAQEEANEAQKESEQIQVKSIEDMLKLSDAQLKRIGLTKDEVDALRELEKQSEKTGIPLKEILEDPNLLSGRSLMLNGLLNIGESILSIFKSIGSAWKEIFDPIDAIKIYDFIAAFHKFTTKLKPSEQTLENLKNTFKGLFAILDLVKRTVGTALSYLGKGLSKLFSSIGGGNIHILEFTGNIGESIVKFRDWVVENNKITEAFQKMGKGLANVGRKIKEFFKAFVELPSVQAALNRLKDIFGNLKEIGLNAIEGLKDGIQSGVLSIPEALAEIGRNMLEAIKGVLGIHSPSTEMFAIGEFSIEGLVEGLKSGASKVMEVIKQLGENIVKSFGADTMVEAVFKGGSLILLAKLINNITGFIGGLSNVLKGAGKTLDGVGEILEESAKGIGKVVNNFADGIKKLTSAKAFAMRAEGIKSMAISIAIIAGSLIALSFIDVDKLWDSVKVLGVLAGILLGMSVAVSLMAKSTTTFKKGEGLKIESLKPKLLAIASAVLILAAACKIVGTMEADEITRSLVALGIMAGGLVAFMVAFSQLTKKEIINDEDLNKLGKTLLKISASILIMVVVCKLVGKLTAADMIKGAIFVGAFLLFVTGLTKMTSGKIDWRIDQLGKTLLSISAAILLMVVVCKLIGKLTAADMIKGAVFVIAFAGFVKLLMYVTDISAKENFKMADLTKMVLSISVAMLIMVGVCKLVSMLSVADMIKGAAFMLAFLGFVKILVSITTVGEKTKTAKLAGTLLAMSIAIGILAGVCVLLSFLDTKSLAKGIAAVGALSIMMSMMMIASKFAGKSGKTIAAMALSIGVMAVSLMLLSAIDVGGLIKATVALGAVMGMFAVMMKQGSLINKGGMGSLIVMTAAIAVIAGMIAILAQLPLENVMGTATALSAVMLSLAATMKILSSGFKLNAMALVSAGVMLLMVFALSKIIGSLAKLPVESTLNTAKSLSMLILSLSAATAILALAGLGGPAALIGIASLAALIAGIGGLIVGIGALATKFPQMEEFLNKGIPILEKIGHAIGSFFGNIVGGFMSSVSDSLVTVGENLSAFMDSIQPFLDGIANVDESSLNGAKLLAQTVIAMTGANLISKINEFLSFGSDNAFEGLGKQLTSFGNAMVDFSNIISGNIDEDAVNAASNCGKAIAALYESMPKTNGWAQTIFGESMTFDTFGAQLTSFGTAIVDFSKQVAGNVDEDAVKAAGNAGQVIASLYEKIPKTGGWAQEIMGTQSLENFGTQMVAFGKAVVDFSSAVAGGVDEAAVESATNAGKLIAGLYNSGIPKTGGWAQEIMGEQSLENFGAQMIAFGEAVVGFSNTVKDGVDPVAVEAAANAGKVIAALYNSGIPKTGGWAQEIMGTQDLGMFGDQMIAFGKALVGFSNEVSGGTIDEEAIASAVNAATIVAKLDEILPEEEGVFEKIKNCFTGGDEAAMEQFSNMMSMLATTIADFSNNIPTDIDLSSIETFETAINKVTGVVKKMSETDFGSADSFKTAINKLNKALKTISTASIDNVDEFVEAIKKLGDVSIDTSNIKASAEDIASAVSSLLKSVKSDIEDSKDSIETAMKTAMKGAPAGVKGTKKSLVSATKTLINGAKTAIKETKDSLKSAVTAVVTYATSGLTSYYTSFFTAGTYLGSGLVAGIKSKETAAYNAGYALGKAAADGVEDGEDANSPSKRGIQAGKWLGEGLVIGINKMGHAVYTVAHSMGDTASSAISDTISRISELVNSDMDTQPTIRPVMDLSNVTAGASAINSLLGIGHSVGITTNARAITAMRSKNQNGGNSDVVDAINKLGKSIPKGGDNYNINGITYSEGDEVADAIKVLTRAALQERRV